MALQINIGRSLVSKKLVGAIFAVFALLVQPLVALNVPSVFAATGTPGSVVINEFSANNGTDWVELYNTTGAAVDLTGWRIRDASASNSVTLSGNIGAGAFLSVDFGTNLNASADTIKVLDDTDSTVINTVTYPADVSAPAAGQYATRTTDGGSTWVVRTSHTQGITNTASANATLSSTLGSTAVVNESIVFSSTVTKAPGSSTPFVRVKTTLTDPAQVTDVTYEYESAPGIYTPMVFTANETYYGASAGFPLTTATGNMRITFKKPGTYQSVAQIVEAGTDAPIGNSVEKTVTVDYRDVPAAAPQSTEIVRPADLAGSGWVFYNDSNDTYTTAPSATSKFVTDPADSSKGALQFSDPTNKMDIASFDYAGTPLEDISAIGYDSYNTSSSNARTYIQFNVDFNGTDTWQKRLTYIPATSNGTWQSNEGVQNGEGMWQWSGGTTWPDGKVASTRTWNDIVASFPNARIRVTDTNAPGGGVFVRSEPGSTNYIDNVYVATASSNVKYNFEMPDVTGPALDVTTPAADGMLRAPGVYTLEGTVSDAGVGVDRLKVQIKDVTDNVQVLSPTNVTQFSGDDWSFEVASGTFVNGHKYNITVNAYDNANNLTTVRRTVTIDNAKPVTFEIDDPSDGETVAKTFTVSGTAYDDISGIDSVRYNVRKVSGIGGVTSGGAVIPWTDASYSNTTNEWSFNVTNLDEGYYRITVQGSDAVGNSKARHVDVYVDATGPTISIVSTTRNADGTYTIVGTVSEPVSTVQVSINGGLSQTATVSGTSWSFVTNVLTDGLYTVDVMAVDTTGNSNAVMGYQFQTATPFTPSARPVVFGNSVNPIDEEDDEVTGVQSVVYVPQVNTGSDADDEGAVLGTETVKNAAKTSTPVVDTSEEGWKLLGMAWYWWAVIVAAVGGAGWASLNWFRGRNAG